MPPDLPLADARGEEWVRQQGWDREGPDRSPASAGTTPHNTGLARDLYECATLARGRDWRAVRDRFLGHRFTPLAMLSGNAADALIFFDPPDICAGKMIALAAPAHRAAIADLLGTFGLET